jgi:hypothetical protein
MFHLQVYKIIDNDKYLNLLKSSRDLDYQYKNLYLQIKKRIEEYLQKGYFEIDKENSFTIIKCIIKKVEYNMGKISEPYYIYQIANVIKPDKEIFEISEEILKTDKELKNLLKLYFAIKEKIISNNKEFMTTITEPVLDIEISDSFLEEIQYEIEKYILNKKSSLSYDERKIFEKEIDENIFPGEIFKNFKKRFENKLLGCNPKNKNPLVDLLEFIYYYKPKNDEYFLIDIPR